jgi:uncharacterized delta-60 repeat protein
MKHILLIIFTTTALLGYTQSAGNLDFDFNGNGIWNKSLATENDIVYQIATDNQNKIILAGNADSSSLGISLLTISRLNPDGSFDNSFSSDGIVKTIIDNKNFQVVKLLVQNDRKIIAVCGGNNELALVRLNANGSLDNTFSFDGKVVTNAITLPRTATLDKDGNIFVLGDKGVSGSDLVIAKFNSSGSLDVNFGTAGVKTTSLVFDVRAKSIFVDNDANIYVGGHYYSSQSGKLFLTRLTSSGNVDFNFIGSTGYSSVVFNQSAVMTDMQPSKNGGFIVLGQSSDGICLAKFAANGKLIAQFGNGGRAEYLFGLKSIYSTGLAEQPDGKILVGGHVFNTALESYFIAARFEENGAIDNSFGTNGYKLIAMSSKPMVEWPSSYATCLQADFRFLIAGTVGPPNGLNMTITRVLTGVVSDINELENVVKTRIFVANNIVTVHSPNESRLNLIDFTGRKLESFNLSSGTSQLNLGYLPDGIYFLKEGKETFKVVVSKY